MRRSALRAAGPRGLPASQAARLARSSARTILVGRRRTTGTACAFATRPSPPANTGSRAHALPRLASSSAPASATPLLGRASLLPRRVGRACTLIRASSCVSSNAWHRTRRRCTAAAPSPRLSAFAVLRARLPHRRRCARGGICSAAPPPSAAACNDRPQTVACCRGARRPRHLRARRSPPVHALACCPPTLAGPRLHSASLPPSPASRAARSLLAARSMLVDGPSSSSSTRSGI